jgi:hypothetical protein
MRGEFKPEGRLKMPVDFGQSKLGSAKMLG